MLPPGLFWGWKLNRLLSNSEKNTVKYLLILATGWFASGKKRHKHLLRFWCGKNQPHKKEDYKVGTNGVDLWLFVFFFAVNNLVAY